MPLIAEEKAAAQPSCPVFFFVCAYAAATAYKRCAEAPKKSVLSVPLIRPSRFVRSHTRFQRTQEEAQSPSVRPSSEAAIEVCGPVCLLRRRRRRPQSLGEVGAARGMAVGPMQAGE